MSDEEKKEYEELKSLLYTGTISQYGKRKLIDIIEKQQKEIEKLKANMRKRITYCNELEKDLFENCTNYVVSKDKIKAKIEEVKDGIYDAKIVLQSLLEKE